MSTGNPYGLSEISHYGTTAVNEDVVRVFLRRRGGRLREDENRVVFGGVGHRSGPQSGATMYRNWCGGRTRQKGVAIVRRL